MATAVFCMAASEFQAEAIVNELRTAGFSDGEISVLLTDKASRQRPPQAPVGGTAGSALGWLPGIRAVTVPGAGILIATGLLLSSLIGSGKIAPALAGMGLSVADARRLEQKIRAGNIIIAVHSETSEGADRARAIFQQAGITDLVCTVEGESHDEAPDVPDENGKRY